MGKSNKTAERNKTGKSIADLPAELQELVRRIQEGRPPAPEVRVLPGLPRKLAGNCPELAEAAIAFDAEFARFEDVCGLLRDALIDPGQSEKVRARRRCKLASRLRIDVRQLGPLLRSVTVAQIDGCFRLMEAEAAGLERPLLAKIEAEAAAKAAAAPRYAYLSGDTYPVRDAIRARGWKWDAQRKAWFLRLAGDKGTPDEILHDLQQDEPFVGRTLTVEIVKGYRR